MRENKLMLNDVNDEETEFLLIGTQKQLSKVSIKSIKVGKADVTPVTTARNLGTWFDSQMNMSTHITKTFGSAFYYLYNLCHIRKYLSRKFTERLVHAFITGRLDYCNYSLLYGVLEYRLEQIATRYECQCTFNLCCTQMLPHNAHASRASLVTIAHAHRF